MTAQRPSTDTDSTYDLGFVPDTYLTQLDPGLKYRRQILYQLTEINPSICGKIKQNLVIIEGILHIDQLHLKTVLANFFLADPERLFLFDFIIFFSCLIILICHANHCLQRLYYLAVVHIPASQYNKSKLNSSGGLHNYMFSSLNLQFARRKIIDFSRLTKSDTNYSRH